jgi:cobalamin biosynthesis Mg chelatase CobN
MKYPLWLKSSVAPPIKRITFHGPFSFHQDSAESSGQCIPAHRAKSLARNPAGDCALAHVEARRSAAHNKKASQMSSIIYLVGLVVVVMFVLSLVGLS